MPKFIVLAGGFGTRLRKAVKDVPKTLAPINGKPFLFYIMQKWVEAGFTDFLFLLHFESDKIIDELNNLKTADFMHSVDIDFIVEEKPLGTGGSIANAILIKDLNDPFILSNSDTWLSGSFSDIVNNGINNIGVIKHDDCLRYGSIDIENNRIVKFNEKSPETDKYINSGLYYLTPSIFQPWDGNKMSIETDIFPYMAKNKELTPFYIDGELIDIGVPEDYHMFCNKNL